MVDLSYYERQIELYPQLVKNMSLRMTKYIPHKATPKQRLFLSLPNREAFYGGAAGGGKSDALLMGALQHVDIPGYNAIIFRRTLADLKLPSALISRASSWLAPFIKSKEVTWKDSSLVFPSGARIHFGYLDGVNDKYRYQGAELQYIAFDELTHFRETDYLYLFSRNRHPECPEHLNHYEPSCTVCHEFFPVSQVPLRMRCASNPGGIGHAWVRKRFQIGPIKNKTVYGRQLYMGRSRRRPHIPAFLEDNPYLNQTSYTSSLSELDPVTREQLLAGDWGVSAQGRLKLAWARYYRRNHEHLQFGGQASNHVVNIHDCTKFVTVDTANSSKEGPADETANVKKRSWTVFSLWFLEPKQNHLAIHRVYRFRDESPEIIQTAKRIQAEFSPSVVCMEYTTASSHLFQMLSRMGFPMRKMQPASDKVSRNTDFANRMHQGRIFFPEEESQWRENLFDELFTWTGSDEETDDQVDTCSYAGIFVSQLAAGLVTEDHLSPQHRSQIATPFVC